jgi:hypothetical protein
VFLGHFGLALAAKRAAPRTSLGTLVAASEWLDLVWPVLVLAGVERVRIAPGDNPLFTLDFESYPLSHSALLALAWSIAFGAVYAWRTGYRRGAAVAGALVFSHWVLDLASHRPDLPLWPGGPKVGLGLWSSVPATLVVELGILAAGIVAYAGATRPRNRTGRLALAGFVAFLLLAYASSLAGPPPPSATAVGAVGVVAGALLVAWAAWIDRNRGRAPAIGLGPATMP